MSQSHPSSRCNGPATALPVTRFPAATPASRAEIDRLVARGRRLQGEALRAVLRRGFRYLVGGCILTGRHQPCC